MLINELRQHSKVHQHDTEEINYNLKTGEHLIIQGKTLVDVRNVIEVITTAYQA